MRVYLLLIACLLCVASPAAGKNETCVDCHTDGSILESLVAAPAVTSSTGMGPARPAPGAPYYGRFLVDPRVVESDPHFSEGCSFCHKGDGGSSDQEKAHRGVVKRPSEDLKVCENCHEDMTRTYRSAPHYTAQGMRAKVSQRFSAKEEKIFTEKVFQKSCRSCHASCGDCHVSRPAGAGLPGGLLKGHRFVKNDEGQTCAVCHGERVYAEYAGKLGGPPDVHHQKGMACTDCHKKEQLHGGGGRGGAEGPRRSRPACTDCHRSGKEAKTTARLAHGKHDGRVSCYGCHSQGAYSNCHDCHIGKGATAKPRFILGADPGDKKTLTTLRTVPVNRQTFLPFGIAMEHFDNATDYRAAAVHNIGKRTERTRSCDVCHIQKKGFLTKESLIKGGSKANGSIIFNMRPAMIN